MADLQAFIGPVIDVVLIVLLLGAIIQAFRVHHAMNVIRSGQSELSGIVGSLNASISEAQRSVSAMKSAATDAGDTLGRATAEALKLADELTLITEAGNNLADRIESGLTRQRGDSKAAAAPDARSLPKDEKAHAEQKALLDALKTAR